MKKLAILLFLMLFLSGCSDNWGWYVVNPYSKSGWINLKFLMSGYYFTLLLSFTSILISIAVGLLIALPGLSKNPWLRNFNRVYVEIVRSVPILVLILWVYYGLPPMTGLEINVFWAGVIALSLNAAAFVAEVVRGGVGSIEKGQTEAAKAIGMRPSQILVFILLPQAYRQMVPPLTNELISLVKNSSLLSVISVYELTRAGQAIISVHFVPFEIYTLLALYYYALIKALSWLSIQLERRLPSW